MKGYDKNSIDPQNPFNQALVANWAAYVITNHFEESLLRDNELYDFEPGQKHYEAVDFYTNYLVKPLEQFAYRIKPKYDESTIDHVVPKSRGGETSWTNCVLACYRCNSQKADREPHEAFKPNDRRASLWRGPSPMKLHKAPVRPKMPSFADERIKVLDTWKHWIDKLYWNVTLDNDMQKEGE